jgi:hypothetical protein
MANVKITELTDIGTPASDDVLEIVDISTNTSKKVQVSALGGGATPTLQEVTTEGNETTDDIIVRDGDWTLNLKKDIGLSPLVTMEHDVYGPRGIYTAQGIQLNSVSELETNCQMAILAERNEYIGFKVQNEDLVNTGNNLLTTLTFPLTSSIDQLIVQRDFVFPDKAEGTYTLATTDDVGGATDLAYTPSPTNGIVTSSTGTDATLPLADGTNAGLLKPDKYTVLENTSNTNSGDNATNSQYSGLQAQVDLRTRELLQDFTDYTSTGVLTEQIISNQAITANDMKINSFLNFISTYSRTGTTNATVSIYLNTTSNSLSGAVKIAMATITSTQSLPCFKRDFSINASSVLRGILFSANAVTDEIATQAQSTTTLTLGSAYYLITTVSLNNVADTVTQRAINLKSSK